MVTIEQKLYSIPEAAKPLNVCDSTLWKLVRAGKVKTVRIGKRRFVTAPVLQSILNGEMDLGE